MRYMGDLVKGETSGKVLAASAGALLAGSLVFGEVTPAVASDLKTILIHDVSIVDVQRGEVVPSRDVLVRDGLIEQIGAGGSIETGEGTRVIDASGLYLMPGLFDAHVHITAGQEVFEPLLVAHGVVAVRDTGAPTQQVLDLQQSAAADSSLSPELIVTGAIIDGDPPVWPFSEACDTPEQARAAVNRLADAGVNQIKVYSLLKAEVYAAALEQAKARGLPVTGHVPHAVPLREAIAAGHNCIEHFEGFGRLLLELAPQRENGDRPRMGVFAAYEGWMRYDEVDHAALDDVLRAVAEAGVMQCPTVAVWQGIMQTLDEQGVSDDRMKYIPAGLRDFWGQPQYATFAQIVKDALPAKQKLLRRMHELGVPMMIGSDLGNPFVFPGWSVHEEMATFQNAGIAAPEVLRMATIVPATFCGVDDRLGTIEVGKRASMLLVRANPLEDVANAAEIEAVFLKGQLFDRQGIAGLLELAQQRANAEAPAAEDIVLELPGDVEYRGQLKMKYEQWDAGTEHFLITYDDDGWRVAAHVQSKGPGQVPSRTILHFNDAGEFISARWTQFNATPTEATYVIEDGKFIGRSRGADGKMQEAAIDLPENYVIGAPILSADIIITPHLQLDPGEQREVNFVSFGFPSWQPLSYEGVIERREDETIDFGTAEEPMSLRLQRYDTQLRTPMGRMESSAWFDQTGQLRRSELRIGDASLTAEFVRK